MARINRSPQAEQDYLDIWLHIATAGDGPDTADAVVARLDRALETLSGFPHAGTARPEIRPNLRSFPVAPYVLYYVPCKDGISLSRVLHGARDAGRILRSE